MVFLIPYFIALIVMLYQSLAYYVFKPLPLIAIAKENNFAIILKQLALSFSIIAIIPLALWGISLISRYKQSEDFGWFDICMLGFCVILAVLCTI